MPFSTESSGPGDAHPFFLGSGSPRYVDVHGFGKDLAIGMRTGWIGGFFSTDRPSTVRVLRVDTTAL